MVRKEEVPTMQYIRQALPQDLPYIYSIALQTAFAGLDGRPYFNDQWCVGHYYAAPYLFFEPDVCFIALDENSRVSGYIVGTSNTRGFNTWMHQTWLPVLQEQYKQVKEFKSEAEQDVIKTLLKGPGEGLWQNLGYPAHLHIDILEHLQGKGIGKSLMLTFFDAVKKKGASGVHLGVDGRNTRAYGFYEKMGFGILEQQNWGSLFGKKLN